MLVEAMARHLLAGDDLFLEEGLAGAVGEETPASRPQPVAASGGG